MSSLSKAVSLSERMKWYEGQQTGRLMPLLPAFARLDGRNFHSLTKDMQRPYDWRLTTLMLGVTQYLVEETGARLGYTQSDEITLFWYSDDPKSQIFCDGRVHKMISLLAAMTSVRFYQGFIGAFPDRRDSRGKLIETIPMFDCRVWSVPTLNEAANVFIWRERDATKNSISMAGRSEFSHNQLLGKNGKQIQEMLWREKGINWNDYPSSFKRGTYVARRKTCRAFTAEEIEKLPPLHAARKDPNLIIDRTDIVKLDLPPIDRIHNKTAVLFEGAAPLVENAEQK
jgi:tRNA(His) guanylyltransferase